MTSPEQGGRREEDGWNTGFSESSTCSKTDALSTSVPSVSGHCSPCSSRHPTRCSRPTRSSTASGVPTVESTSRTRCGCTSRDSARRSSHIARSAPEARSCSRAPRGTSSRSLRTTSMRSASSEWSPRVGRSPTSIRPPPRSCLVRRWHSGGAERSRTSRMNPSHRPRSPVSRSYGSRPSRPGSMPISSAGCRVS